MAHVTAPGQMFNHVIELTMTLALGFLGLTMTLAKVGVGFDDVLSLPL
jgi:hypothetical protein